MAFGNRDGNMEKMQSFIGKKHKEKLVYYSALTKMPMSRLIAIAVDYELQKEKPFEWDYSIPKDDYVEYAYADEAGKIVNYVRALEGRGMPLDMLLLVREDIGIKDKASFLAAFRECLEKDLIEAYTTADLKYNEGTVFYRLKGLSPLDQKKFQKKISEFQKYERLKRKFEK